MTALLTADQVTAPGWYWWRETENHRWIPIEVTPCPVRLNVMTFTPFPGEAAHVDLRGVFVKAAAPDDPSRALEAVTLSIDVDIKSVEQVTAALDGMTAAAERARAAVAAIGCASAEATASTSLEAGR